MSERWRCFVAVPIGDDLRVALAAALPSESLEGMRWAEPAAWHVTLAFLGPVPASDVPRIAAVAERVASTHAPMRLPTGGLGAFPSASRARVLWYGIADPHGTMAALATDLHQALGVELGAPYRPHLTLARARRTPVAATAWLAAMAVPAGELLVDRVELMRSHLGTGPARYERLASASLGVPVYV